MPTTSPMPPIRVGQWATGAVGRESMACILDAPGLELVAAYVTDPAKVGSDLGVMVGRAPIGLAATGDVGAFLACEPDCVVYAPRVPAVGEVAQILRAGIDVVTTAFCFHPRRMDPLVRDELDAACREGGATLHGSGINPGNFGMVAPLALSGLVRQLRSVSISERADWSAYASTDITFDVMRFGAAPAEATPEHSDGLALMSDLFRQQVWFLGDALDAGLDEVVVRQDTAVATEDLAVFDRILPAGGVNAQRWYFAGRRDGRELVVVDCQWTIGPAEVDWPDTEHGWTVELEGDPSIRAHLMSLASLTEPRSMEEHVRAASAATAAQVVNAIPGVHAAPPGFATAAELPLVRSLQGFGAGRG